MVMILATVRRNDSYRIACFQSAVDRLIDIDGKVRRHAFDNNRPCRILFDFDKNVVQASRWVEGKEKFLGFALEQNAQLRSVRRTTGSFTDGVHEIVFNHVGAGPTYGIEVGYGETAKWIVFTGRTGQVNDSRNEEEIDAMFEALRQQRIDTD